MTSTPILKGQIFGLPLFTAVCLSVQARPATLTLWNHNRLEVDTQDMIFNPEQAYLLMPYNRAIRTVSDVPDRSYILPKMAGTGIPAFQMMPAFGDGPEADLVLLNDGNLVIRSQNGKEAPLIKTDMPYLATPFFAKDTKKTRKKMKRLLKVSP